MACVVVAVHVNGDASQTSLTKHPELKQSRSSVKPRACMSVTETLNTSIVTTSTPHHYTRFVTFVRASFKDMRPAVTPVKIPKDGLVIMAYTYGQDYMYPHAGGSGDRILRVCGFQCARAHESLAVILR
jgi:hypothetical protein